MSSAARYTVAVAICVLVIPVASCSRSGSAATGGRPNVVAAENVWGSIAAQLGGDRVTVTSIIDNPNADPHDYEPTTEDARAMAAANLVIENGVGYDPWAQRLIDANPVSGRRVLDVGTLVGVTTDGNPHRWYSPSDVQQVIDAITLEYTKLDPADASYFEHQRSTFQDWQVAQLRTLAAALREATGR